MTIDIIVSWPRWADYPVFRETMRLSERNSYNRLIVSFTGLTDNQVMEAYVRGMLLYAAFTLPIGARGDWRNVAVNNALAVSDAGHVLFLEQDFFIRVPGLFFHKLSCALNEGHEFVGFKEAGRIHPACLLVSRDKLEHTTLDFSAGEAGHDHFWFVTKELGAITEFKSLESLGLARGRDWWHMNGLTHNYDLVRRGEPVTYEKARFALYNLIALRIGSHPDFESLMGKCVRLVPPEGLVFGGMG